MIEQIYKGLLDTWTYDPKKRELSLMLLPVDRKMNLFPETVSGLLGTAYGKAAELFFEDYKSPDADRPIIEVKLMRRKQLDENGQPPVNGQSSWRYSLISFPEIGKCFDDPPLEEIASGIRQLHKDLEALTPA